MEKYNSSKNEYVKKRDPKSLAVEIVAILAIAVLVVAMVMIGANKGGSTTSIFAAERKTYVLNDDYRVSELDFNVIGSTENNLRLTDECTLDLNGKEFDLNGYALTIVPTYSGGLIAIINGTIKNGTLIIDSDENNVLIDNVVFDKTLRYTLNCSGAEMTIKSSTVISRNLKVTGGTLRLDNAKLDNYSLTSNLVATESTIGTITTAMDNITINATDCALGGIAIRSNNVTLEGDINCEVEVSKGATASADSNEIIDVKVKDKVSILNVNADANVTLLREGFTEYGATVDTLNIYYEGAVINAENCSTIGVLSSYVNARINLYGVVRELNLLEKSTVVASRAAIVEKMLVRQDATIDFSGSVYKATFEGNAVASFNASSYVLDLEVLDNSTATIALNCSNGAVARIYNNMSNISVQRDCKTLVIDYTNGTAQISNDSAIETVFEENISDDEIKNAISTLMIPILYVDSTCDIGGRYVLAPGANKESTKLSVQSISSSGHIYDRQIIKDATENENGLELQVCKLCGVSREVVINRKKILYTPNTIADYLGLLLDAGEYDYSLDENSGYILNKVGGEGGSSSSEDGMHDLLIFNKCYAHLSVEKIKTEEESRVTGTMRLFGDIEVDAVVLKGYVGNIDEPINESNAQEVNHYQLTGAFKDSILAYTYYGPEFVFLKEGEHLINFGALADFVLLTAEDAPEDFDSQDLINIIETVRRIEYYFERYGSTLKFVVQALLNKIDLGAVVPGLSLVAKDETEENKYYLSFQHLKDQLMGTKGNALGTYLDDIFGPGTVTDLLRYAYNLPDERIEDIYSTLCYLAGSIAGMSEDALIDNFNILLEILLNDAIDNLPGDIPTIKNNIKQYFGVSFDIRNAVQNYGKKTIFELIYGEYVEDPQSEDPQADYEQYINNKKEFDAYWINTIGSIDNTVLNSSMDAIVTGLLESFGLYTEVNTFDELLNKMVELDKYFDLEWYEDDAGHKLTSELTVYIPDDLDDKMQTSTGAVSGVFQKVMTFLSQHVPFFANLGSGAGSTADEGEANLIQVFNCTYDNVNKCFQDMLFDWQYVDEARFIVTVTGTELVETLLGDFYTNNFNVNITKPMDESEDIVLLNFDFHEKTMSISNLEANYIVDEDNYFVYHNYNSYIEGDLAIKKDYNETTYNALLSLRADYKEGHLASDAFVIGDDATPTSVVKDKLNLFSRIKLNLLLKDFMEIPEIEVFALTFDPLKLADGKQYLSLTTFMPIDSCMEYRLLFDDDEFYAEGYHAISGDVTQRYRITNDKFLRNEEGKIRGASLIANIDSFEKFDDMLYYYKNEYHAYGAEFFIGKPIEARFFDYSHIHTDYSILRLNEIDFNKRYGDIYVMDNGDVYVIGNELNPDFNPDRYDINRWRKYATCIGNVNDDPDLIYNIYYTGEGKLYLDAQNLALSELFFELKYNHWAHFSTLSDAGEYVSSKNYNAWEKDMEGVLDPYELTYQRYDTHYNLWSTEHGYKNWIIDEETGVATIDQYVREGGNIKYDKEEDLLTGSIYEYLGNGNSRLKYYIEDEKLIGERYIRLMRNRYEGDSTEISKTDMYLTLNIVYGDKQDAWNFILGSDWLYKAEMALYSKHVKSSYKSYEEITADNMTELYQLLLFKDFDGSYCGAEIKLYDYEVAFEASFDEFMVKLDTRRFGLPLVIDILINRLDLDNIKFIVQYIVGDVELVNFNVIGDTYGLDAIGTLQDINYITAHKDNWTDEWFFQFTLPLIDEGYGVDYFNEDDPLFRYYRFSVIYNLEDIDVVMMRHGVWVNDNWLTRGLPIPHERTVVTLNYNRATKVSKTDFTILQLGPISLHASLMWSPTVYKYIFSLILPLNEELQFETAGKESIKSIDFITISGNRETDALNVTMWTLLGLLLATEDSDLEDLAFSYMRNPDGNNGICIFNYDSDHYKGYSDDLWRGMEYMSFVYNLTDYTCSIMVRDYVTITVDIDENDPSIRNAYCYIPIISLERSFKVTRLDDDRFIATSNIWNDNLGIYEPLTFVIQYYDVQIDEEYELYANIENGLGTDAYYVGQVDYIKDPDSTNIYATITTDIDIVSDISIYRVDIYTDNNEYYEPTDENDVLLYNKYIKVPFCFENSNLGIKYNCEINFVISPDPAKAILNAGTEDEISVEDFCDKFIEDTMEITDDLFAKQVEDLRSYKEMEKQNQD